jgi:tetratricopeptide (TPR) repeat protein
MGREEISREKVLWHGGYSYSADDLDVGQQKQSCRGERCCGSATLSQKVARGSDHLGNRCRARRPKSSPNLLGYQRGNATIESSSNVHAEDGASRRILESASKLLQLAVVMQYAQISAQEGRYVADKLLPFIDKVRALVPRAQGAGWTDDARSQIKSLLAAALIVYGEQTGDDAAFEEAIGYYREVLQASPRLRVPLNWAMAQNALGVALMNLGERESGSQHLTEAVAAFRAALEERTRARVPLDWAMTQNNLGVALVNLGEHESGTQHLIEDVAAFRAALQEYTQARMPLEWATVQDNLGAALTILGERKSSAQRLLEALAAYRAALEERTRARVPLDWAGTQNDLGTALTVLGQRESGTQHLTEAVAAYRATLKERTRAHMPLQWAMT